MNTLEELFPSKPTFSGTWQTLYLEPIVGSGERISVAVVAIGKNNQYRILQAIRSELLECLYGAQSRNMQSLIDWLIESASKEIKANRSLSEWTAPFDGIKVGKLYPAAGDDIEGILKQAIRFTASLSTLALDADRDDHDFQPKRYSEQWATSIFDEIKTINPHLSNCFKKRLKISESNVLTTFGFLKDTYVSNFGLLVPTRLSTSLSNVKAKLFDLEALKKSPSLVKPLKYEIIIGTPSLSDPTLTDKSAKNLRETIDMVTEVAASESIDLFRAENAREAAMHIIEIAA
ncbi:hypothetical protein G8770_19230 [Aestuariicella hydrocarbonica]|uniref:Uncharacterized protein n=1 Tax=Pseudomaricurvus hydrocarbonicus TaxID=1470433 RepID=A0A9E5MNU0_9GAMM|nr:hypothetical protein [Aestuariicella hydrocarbonica]NHO67685.1 hypothetical protein [Aestuariicella hydrocarbonica]